MFLLGNISANAQISGLNQNQTFWRIDIILSLLFFAVIAGLRYDVGVDYLTYLSNYNNLKTENNAIEHFEPGFNWIMQQFAFVDAHPAFFFGFFAFIQLFFIFLAFKNEKYLYPALCFVIMTGGIYFTMMNEIRQSIVWALFIYAVKFTESNKLLTYLTLTFVGFLFHTSALLLIPLYLFLIFNKDFFKSKWLQLILFALVIIISENRIWNNIISEIENLIKIFGYSDKYGDISSKIQLWDKDYIKGVRYYGMVAINLLIIFYSNKLKQFYPQKVFVKFYNLYFVGLLLDSLFYYNTLFQRPARYFTCFQIVLTTYFIYYLWLHRRESLFNVLLLVLIIIVHIIILTAFIKSDHHTIYKFFWQS